MQQLHTSTWVQMPTVSRVLAQLIRRLVGGAANDTFSFTGVYFSSSIVGGAGADSFAISGVSTDSTLLGGAGNDTVGLSAGTERSR